MSEQDTEQETPKIEFPCDYPIKVMGVAGDELRRVVIEVMIKHAPEFDELKITLRESGKGTYHALTATIIATGEPQLQAIFEDLKKSDQVKMVL